VASDDRRLEGQRTLLLSRLSGFHRFTWSSSIADLPSAGAARVEEAVLIRRFRRLGPGEPGRPECPPGKRHEANRPKRSALRDNDRGRALLDVPVGYFDRHPIRRPRLPKERCLWTILLGAPGPVDSALRGAGQSRTQRVVSAHVAAATCSRYVERPLQDGDVLLPERHARRSIRAPGTPLARARRASTCSMRRGRTPISGTPTSTRTTMTTTGGGAATNIAG
jgi:hypothetical protein